MEIKQNSRKYIRVTVKQKPSLVIALYIHQVILKKIASQTQRSSISGRQSFSCYSIDSKPILKAFSVHIVSSFFFITAN